MAKRAYRPKHIVVVCYNQIEKWNSRDRAIAFYRQASIECEGAERDRYLNIYWALMIGDAVCHDGDSRPYSALLEEGRRYETTAPDGSRDYGGKIWYSKN